MSKKIIGIILIVAGLVTAALGIKAVSQNPEIAEKVNDAVYVEDAKIHPENEGKIVIVSGTVKPEGKIIDPATGVEVDSFKVSKSKWKAAYSKAEGRGYDWSWIIDGATETLYAEASVGEFELGDEMFINLSTSSDVSEYNEAELKKAGFMEYYDAGVHYVVTKDVYISEAKGGYSEYIEDYSGAVRYSYKYLPMADGLKYTFVGLQKDGKLEKVDGIASVTASEGILDKEAILEKFESASSGGNIFAFVSAALLVAGGVVCLVIKKKEV